MGAKHFEKLTKKKIVDKTGKQRTVWVKIDNGEPSRRKVRQAEKKVGKKVKKESGMLGKIASTVGKKVKENIGMKAKSVKKKQQATYDKHEGASLFKKKMKGIVKNIKEEVDEWKSAATGIKKFITKSGDLTDHEKKAIKTVAIHAAIVVASSLVSSSGAGILVLAKSIGLGYLEHAGILKIGHALVFAKGEDDEHAHEDHEAEHYIERLIMSMSNYMEKEANGNSTGKSPQSKN